jgi:tetratricopeptide (TPR) repeat protein
VTIVKAQKLLFTISSCILVALLPVSLVADVTDVQRLISQGDYQSALQMTEQELNGNSGSVTYRFLKGLILTRMDRLGDASEVFIDITISNPDLPEPYNNLAVIYASQGEFDKAREYLQQAINTHPAYATAHENIGDIYAKLASEAYNQALELDQENVTARAKLSLVNDLFSMPEEGKVLLSEANQEMMGPVTTEADDQAAQQQEQERAQAQRRLQEQLESSQQEQQRLRDALREKEIELEGLLKELETREQEKQRMEQQQEARELEQERLREELREKEMQQQRMAEQQQATVEEQQRLREELAAREQEQQRILEQQRQREQQQAREQEQERARTQQQESQRDQAVTNIKDTVLDWAGVWMRQNVDAYLGHYSDEFLPGDGRTLRAWQQYRRNRLTAPGEIRVVVSDLVVELMGSDHAQASFTQVYESDTYSDRVKKTLLMKLEGENWRITQELTN